MKKKKIKESSILLVKKQAELMKFLSEELKGKSRNNIKSLLLHRQVSVNGINISQYNHVLNDGDEVKISWVKTRTEKNVEGFKVIYEDNDIVIISKPVGLLSIATDKEKEQTAYNVLKRHVKNEGQKNKIFVVHRLDKGTSGLMIFAKTIEAQHTMQTEWKDRVKERTYVAVLEGKVEKKQGKIVSYLKENKAFVTYSIGENVKDKDAKKAITNYKVLRINKNYTMMELKLETGRKNQIRCHMKELGYSITGDKKYGAEKNPIKRLALHALSLSFKHPRTNELMSFDTRIPSKFSNLLK